MDEGAEMSEAVKLYAVKRERGGVTEWYDTEWGWGKSPCTFTDTRSFADEEVEQRMWEIDNEITADEGYVFSVVVFVPEAPND
jgi:hypothetical protein